MRAKALGISFDVIALHPGVVGECGRGKLYVSLKLYVHLVTVAIGFRIESSLYKQLKPSEIATVATMFLLSCSVVGIFELKVWIFGTFLEPSPYRHTEHILNK